MHNTLLVPMAGNSTRFGGELPKFLWEHEGRCMAKIASSGLEWAFNDVKYIVRQDHFDEYFSKIKKHFKKSELCVIDSSKSQAETIYKAVKKLNIQNNFAIKDCDNYFTNDSFLPYGCNFIGVGSLYDYESIQPGNKSYIQTNEDLQVLNIAEKKIISHKFCAGLYAFHKVEEYNNAYEYLIKLKLDKEVNISHIILLMLHSGKIFQPMDIKGYIDFGTEKKWLEYVRSFRDNRI